MCNQSGRKTPDHANIIKITAGMGSIDDYIPFVEAGADEVFVGYVPERWQLKYGIHAPLNRREVRNYNVQIGSLSELRILKDMVEVYQVPVTIALNALSFGKDQYEIISQIVKDCVAEGFCSFIVADPALLVFLKGFLKEESLSEDIRIHVSGEIGEMNGPMIDFCKELGAERIIFHRKVTLKDMQACIARNPEVEYEAFVLNEMCHFHGGFCNSLHCDELCHMCLVPYCLSGEREGSAVTEASGEEKTLVETGTTAETDPGNQLVGATGCGMCAIYDMIKMGMTHVKLVSRGNYAQDTIRDIKALKLAIQIAEAAESAEAYKKGMKKQIFPKDCSHACYYRDEIE